MRGWAQFEQSARKQLDQLSARNHLRTLDSSRFVQLAQRKNGVVDLTTNDYLGFRHNDAFQKALRESIGDLPASAGASRLLGGEHPIFEQLEQEFAKFKGAESALFLNSGFAANEALSSLLNDPDATIFSDQLNHASIVDGLRLLRPRERVVVYKHNDLRDLEEKLKFSTSRYNVVYTESLFSMDGDVSDIPGLLDLCQDYRGVLFIDEAHSTGSYGQCGAGLMNALEISHRGIISVSTCGKALGVQGAFICGPAWLRDLLINRARPFIYSTGTSPWIAAAVLRSLDFVKHAKKERQHLHTMSARVRTELSQLGFDIGKSESFIIPIVLKSEEKTMRYRNMLQEHGIAVSAVRPPTVPDGTCRLRLSMTADFSTQDCERLINALKSLPQ